VSIKLLAAKRLVNIALAVVVFALFTGVSWGQFPDGDGKDLTVKTCGNCHEPERAASLRQDKDGWAATMENMTSQGMTLGEADYAVVLNYLSGAFPPNAVKPLNINTASAIDLESALSLLRSEAAAIIAYRDKHGKFKSLDDVKKVPGVSAAKIDAKKDRIAF
jgi:competence protein ComEA